jgi:hypothetical protein
MWLIVMAALVRKGIVPFHAWVPEVFDHGRLGPAILFSAPQVGAYMTVVLIVPRASADLLRLIAILSLATAVYGAALALVQRSARRACGYLFMSQSALVMAGLDCTSPRALAGGLLVWLSAGLAFAGLARSVLVLEARRGRLDLTTYHGGYERMPVLAISFLAMGLACTGFPGTLGFVGQELLVTGAVLAFPVMGFAVIVAAALTGLAVLRMYFSLFCGRADPLVHSGLRLGLKRREAWTFAALVVALVGFGLFPRPLVDSRFAASDEILRLRQARVPAAPQARRGGLSNAQGDDHGATPVVTGFRRNLRPLESPSGGFAGGIGVRGPVLRGSTGSRDKRVVRAEHRLAGPVGWLGNGEQPEDGCRGVHGPYGGPGQGPLLHASTPCDPRNGHVARIVAPVVRPVPAVIGGHDEREVAGAVRVLGKGDQPSDGAVRSANAPAVLRGHPARAMAGSVRIGEVNEQDVGTRAFKIPGHIRDGAFARPTAPPATRRL